MSFGNAEYISYIMPVSAVVALLYFAYLALKARTLARLVPKAQRRGLIVQGSKAHMRFKPVLVILAIALYAFVMLRPQWGELMREERNEGTDLLVALDVSISMTARDAGAGRLEKAKDAVRMMAGSMRGGRAGLILFAGEAFMQCPLTSDMGAFMMFLDAAGPDSIKRQGTSLKSALDAAGRVFGRKRMTSRVLVLITDGEDHEGAVMTAAEKLRGLDVRIYAVGVGSPMGSEIPVPAGDDRDAASLRDTSGKPVVTGKNEALLTKLARSTGGRYLDITGGLSDVYVILRELSRQEQRDYGGRIVREKIERYQLFAAILAVLLLVEMSVPVRKKFLTGGQRKGHES